jgi:DNA/RNA-binding domain of Phe-tRNA-synthetase-like protein
MNIIVDNELLRRLVRIRLGLLRAKVKIEASPEELIRLISQQSAAVSREFNLEDINKLENIANSRKAYKLTGNDPNRYRPSAESLYRRIVKGFDLYRINNVVDVLNLISLQTGISIGGYDELTIKGSISYGIGREGEIYEGIGRGQLNITNLPVLRDTQGGFGTPTSDSERTKIKETSTNILFVFFDFALSPNLEEIMYGCKHYLQLFCSAGELNEQICHFN